ncbi:MBL fold metallo-hydrolase [Pontibacter mangrovi]|uniref:MBL fold metallo-hydrolase n=1 Tax=Pontibacter mangrovi TaxID=2589816 RepID=A0A501WC21_9BACT|nr:MBL fold metallo-hydrolase [Pontibacter mangrovi]TPE45940.1 MBL fold metallo-hydrolase [Pontibacter mangrovi]
MKLKSILALAFSLGLAPAMAQQTATPDTIKTTGGPLIIQPITHGTLALQFKGKTIYVDPYGGAAGFSGLAKPDLILITDIHPDHLDMSTLSNIQTEGIKIVAPQAVADSLPQKYKQQVVVLKNGDKTEQLGIKILALPMYNLPESADAMHPKGRGNGYLLEMGGKRVYISGDTEGTPEMRNLKNIDVAFVSMNLPYTMDVDQAAEAVLAFKPKIIYPYHYRGKDGLSDVDSFKQQVNTKDKQIEVRLKNWYPEQ